ncbi:MAG: hypothetical protein JWP01_1160 [Myxococcales bacterium]|nr:hypothetical protein [Myxococcales bacterium]
MSCGGGAAAVATRAATSLADSMEPELRRVTVRRVMRAPHLAFALAAMLPLAACTDDAAIPADTVAFDLEGPLAGSMFWNLPFPSDLRLTADGRPDLAGFPNRRELPVVTDLLSVARERAGFPVMPITWFKFTATPPQRSLDQLIVAEPSSDALLIDIDPDSDEHGSLHAVVAQTMADDEYTGTGLIAIAPRPGIVLRGHTRYAVVLRKSFSPTTEVHPAFAALLDGSSSSPAATALYAPLWDTLAELGIARDELLVATVFTTGDETAVLRDRSEAVRTSTNAVIADLHVDPTDGAAHAGFCEVIGTVTLPQFQTGVSPFGAGGGRFELDGTGTPIAQGSMTVPLAITLPTGTMPAAGWPLWQFFHGSGGASFDLVDDGPNATADSGPQIGAGPGAVVARRGIAAAASALPINPERLAGASNYAYLNLNNLAAFPYTFQQGVFEQRLLLDALLALQIPASTVAACAGVTLPTGATAHSFNPNHLTAGGHSMGGMYTNMIGAVEPRFGALTPFGAGGFWPMMILDTSIVAGARNLLGGVLGVDSENLSFVHPSLSLLGLGWEIAEPGAAMSRLARRPLAGTSPRHVYQPIGLDDQFFPNPVFDAAALAYGNRQAGELVWPGTQEALRADHLDGMLTYPVRANRDGTTTSVVVQYTDGGIVDAHQIHRQLDAVKYQYGCFLASYLRDGVPTVPAPAAIDAACP